jgi:hypothetical protein
LVLSASVCVLGVIFLKPRDFSARGCFSESICVSESFRFCLNWPTNFSSLSSASSNGSVTPCAEAVSDVAGDGDAVGDGVVCTTEVLVLLGGAAQPVNRKARKARHSSRRIEIIFSSSLTVRFHSNGAMGVPATQRRLHGFSARLANVYEVSALGSVAADKG